MTRNGDRPANWKEARRKRALELKDLGWKQCDIADALGVSQAAVSRWVAESHQRDEAWRAKPRPSGPTRLTSEQLEAIPELLTAGAESFGFFGDVWTCARIATVLRLEFGVSYHKAHVSRLLKQLNWTPQKPIRRASQRDEDAIADWRTQAWPEIKKRR